MDKQFQVDADTFFSERHTTIVATLRKDNQNHLELMKNIAKNQELVKSQIPEETWLLIKELLVLLDLQNHVESTHLYIQGIKDCIDLSHFLDMEYITQNYPLNIKTGGSQ